MPDLPGQPTESLSTFLTRFTPEAHLRLLTMGIDGYTINIAAYQHLLTQFSMRTWAYITAVHVSTSLNYDP